MDLLCFFRLVFVMPMCASVICALWSPAWNLLTSWLLFVIIVVLSLSQMCPGPHQN